MDSRPHTHPPLARAAAWAVHAFTASGAVAGMLAWFAIAEGEHRAAFAWMALTVLIDSADGALARWARVKEVLPHFDGALLDNVVDYFTYALLPAFFVAEAALVPEGMRLGVAAAIVLASAYQFCRSDAKTEDHFFTGFPSYWNIVAMYLFLLSPGWPWFNTGVLLLCAALTFHPMPYVYPSRTVFARRWTLLFGALWAAAVLVALWRYPRGHRAPALASLAFVVYYVGLSVYLWRRRAAGR